MSTTTEPAREPGSVMLIDGIELRTTCGHSFAACHTNRCYRLPPAIMAERERVIAAATVEHMKRAEGENHRFGLELNQIEATYRRLAAGLKP